MAETILVVEDETTLLETLVYNLRHQGYKVEGVSDGRAALEAAQRLKPDLLVLDVMLPHLDGFEVTRQLRKDSNIPILMLTARDEEIDRVLGLEIGADDYLTKPFSMRELMARVKALLRRVRLIHDEMEAPQPESGSKLNYGDLTVDLTRHEILCNGSPLALKPKEYDLLVYFARHPNQVLSREQLLEQVWGWDFAGGTRTVDVHVSWLRNKIEPDPSEPSRIVTVRGIGYRFEG